MNVDVEQKVQNMLLAFPNETSIVFNCETQLISIRTGFELGATFGTRRRKKTVRIFKLLCWRKFVAFPVGKLRVANLFKNSWFSLKLSTSALVARSERACRGRPGVWRRLTGSHVAGANLPTGTRSESSGKANKAVHNCHGKIWKQASFVCTARTRHPMSRKWKCLWICDWAPLSGDYLAICLKWNFRRGFLFLFDSRPFFQTCVFTAETGWKFLLSWKNRNVNQSCSWTHSASPGIQTTVACSTLSFPDEKLASPSLTWV